MSNWMSVKEYAQKVNAKSPQVIYNKIANGKLKTKWREIEITKKLKQVYYEKK